jgi:hypothetical protein
MFGKPDRTRYDAMPAVIYTLEGTLTLTVAATAIFTGWSTFPLRHRV